MADRRVYRLDDLSVDLDAQRVSRGDEPLDVGGLSFRLLACLIEHGDRVVDFDTLIANVWSPAVVNEETVTQRVKLLRQALGDDGRRPRYVRSVRGRGYQLCAVPLPIADVGETPPRRRRYRYAVAAAVVLALAAAASMPLLDRRHQSPPPANDEQALLQRASYYAGIGQRDNNERAIALYEQVIAAAPENNAARLGLSRAYSARVCLYNFDAGWAQRAQALAEQAIAAEPGDAAAHAALAYSHDCRGRIDAALRGYERAVELDPEADASRASAAYLYERKGRLADALAANLAVRDPSRARFLAIQIASNLELLGFAAAAERRYADSFRLYPDSVYSNIAWPRFLFAQGRFSEAQAALGEAFARGTEHVDLHLLAGELALLRGERAAASAAFARAAALRPHASLPATLAALHADAPVDPDWARRRAAALSAALAAGDGYPADGLEIALLQAAAQDRAAALDALAHAVDAGYRDKAYLQVSPLFRPLAGEPAFAAAIDRISAALIAERERVLAADWLPPDLIAGGKP